MTFSSGVRVYIVEKSKSKQMKQQCTCHLQFKEPSQDAEFVCEGCEGRVC